MDKKEDESTALAVHVDAEGVSRLIGMALSRARPDVESNTYLQEAIRVLPVGGHRSAIGSIWNAVVDDLRNKIIHRSLDLFNKEVPVSGHTIKTYEDFQEYVTDDHLITGAYKVGVVGWEAFKMMRQAKETRHIFDGHPRSSDPSVIKVLAMIDDCVKYVLSQPYPSQIIDITDYLTMMGSKDFDRNDTAIQAALSELPEIYKTELINRLYTAYVHPDASSVLRSNIEFVAPLFWSVLPKTVKFQVGGRVDRTIAEGHAPATEQAFAFVQVIDGTRYLSATARVYKLKPIVESLRDHLDEWTVEDASVRLLQPYAAFVPPELLDPYVSALVHTYVGHTGSSSKFSRTDFYADGAAMRIPKMVELFDDASGNAFINAVGNSPTLLRRLENPTKMNRLRALGNIVLERVSAGFADRVIVDALVDPAREEEFHERLRKR